VIAAEPELLEFVLEAQRLADLGEESAIPLVGGDVLSDCREIDDDREGAGFLQTPACPVHERRFAHLPAVEHVAERAAAQAVEQDLVRLPLDVRRRVAAERAAGDVEAGFGCDHGVISHSKFLTWSILSRLQL